MVDFACDSRATSKMLSWCLLFAFCMTESHESNAHSHRHHISWRKYSIYPLCGQGLSSPPLSPEFCMQAGVAMWKGGLRDGGKGGWKMHGLCMSVPLFPMPGFLFSLFLPFLYCMLSLCYFRQYILPLCCRRYHFLDLIKSLPMVCTFMLLSSGPSNVKCIGCTATWQHQRIGADSHHSH